MESAKNFKGDASGPDSRESQIKKKYENLIGWELDCPICHKLFVSPLTLNCSHIFCTYCITIWKQRNKKNQCPVCAKVIVGSPKKDGVTEYYVGKAIDEMGSDARTQHAVNLKKMEKAMANLLTSQNTRSGISKNCDLAERASTSQGLQGLHGENVESGLLESEVLKKFKALIGSEFVCSICLELFISPVALNCSHTFCTYCITVWKQHHKQTCPICRKSIVGSPIKQLFIENSICRAIDKMGPEAKANRVADLEKRKKVMANLQSLPNSKSGVSANRDFPHSATSSLRSQNLYERGRESDHFNDFDFDDTYGNDWDFDESFVLDNDWDGEDNFDYNNDCDYFDNYDYEDYY